MNKILGIFGLLVFVCVFTGILSGTFEEDPGNLANLIRRSAPYGIIGIGAAFVIITGGIDLAIGAMVCLIGCLLAKFIMDFGWSIYFSIFLVIVLSLCLGLFHGLLVAKLKLQPFVVTLFGFLAYRGFARWFCQDQAMGFRDEHEDGLRLLATGAPWKGFEQNLATLAGLAGIAYLVYTVWGMITRPENRKDRLWESLVAVFFSGLVLFIGFSQYIGGADTVVVKLAGGWDFALAPTSLLAWVGAILFVPLFVMFLAGGLWGRTQAAIWPTLAILGASVFLYYIAAQIAPTFEKLSPGGDEIREFGLLSVSEGTLRNLIMLLVFVATAAWIGSIGWVTSVIPKLSSFSQNLLIPTIVSGVFWLCGQTRLADTVLPMPLVILLACALIASVFLNQTIYGRYLLALGRKEEAARYSGIDTDRMTILAYMICSLLSGLGAILFALDINSMQPANFGNVYELYAIAAAVLGGCSLRGGEGTIVGVIIGAAVVRVIYTSINLLKIDTKLDFVVIGVVLLAGVIVDELVKRRMASRPSNLQLKH